MTKKIGIPAVGVSLILALSITNAAGHSERGEYTTNAQGGLLVENSRVLSGDLFFSKPGMETVVAPKGSELTQSILPVVWQFAALLPVTDYLQTAAIHSVGSNEKIRPWQEVQNTFYNGLIVEGARDRDAKIAYAGAYGFSPRWSLVEFTRIAEAVPAYPNTELFSVEYIRPATKGMTLEAYRKLALNILQRPDDFTLDDIRTVVDEADSSRANLRVINENEVSIELPPEKIKVSAPRVVIELPEEPASVASGVGVAIDSSSGPLLHSGSKAVNKVAETKPIEAVAAPVVDSKKGATVPAEVVTDTSGFVDSEILSSGSAPPAGNVVEPAVLVPVLEGPDDDWVTLPDGTVVLRSTRKLASE